MTVTDSAGNSTAVDITFPAVGKGTQDLSAFTYSPATVNVADTAPVLIPPAPLEGATLSYAAAPASVCTVDASGALTLAGVGTCTVTVTAATTSNYGETKDDAVVTVTVAPVLALTVNTPIATDNIINITEKAAGFTISGATGAVAGATVTVTLGGHRVGTATSAIAVGSNEAAWSVTVPAAATYITGTSLTLSVAATRGSYAPAPDVTHTLTVDLAAPAVSYTAPASLTVGRAITEMLPISADTDIAAANGYAATASLPPGLALDADSGAIAGTPGAHSTDEVTATVTVTDSAGNSTAVDITFPAVGKGTQDLSGFAYSPATVTFGAPTPTVTPPTGAPGTLSYAATPATVCTVDASGALTLVGAGVCTVTLTAALTADYDEATASFTVTVNPAGTLSLVVPTYTAPVSLMVGTAMAPLAPTGGSGIAASNGYAATGLPVGLAINADTGVIAGMPTTAAAAATATVTVRDGGGNSATVDIAFPAVAAEQIMVMIDDNPFTITILSTPNNARMTVNTLSVEDMNAQVPPDNVVFSTPPVNIEVSGLLADEHVYFCLPRGNVPDGFTTKIYTAYANDGTLDSHWDEASDQDDEPEMYRVCAKLSSFSLFRNGYLTELLETANDQLLRLSVSDASAAENAGSLTFSVRLSVAATEVVTVNYATEEGTARRSFDFSHVSGTLRFDLGESEKQVRVTLRDDNLYEERETFTLTLSDPVNAVLGQATATGTIIDDDEVPTLYIRHATAAEGAGELVFKVDMEPTGSLPVTVRWATSDGTAGGKADYQPSGGTLTFNPGEGEKKLRVPVIDDAIDENTENLRVTLSNPVNALLGRAVGTGFIYDDDVRGIRVTPQTVQVDEGTTARFEVVLATQPVGNVTLALMTDAAGSRLTPNLLHFDATNWSRPQTVAVAVPADEDMDDADRMLMLTASGADYVAMRVRVVLSIRDTDRPPDNLLDEDRIVVPVEMPDAFNGMRQ